MQSLFQSIKDSKRRITQKVRIATGHTTLPSDDEFEKLYNQYVILEKHLSKLVDQSKSFAKNINKWCETNYGLAEQMNQFVSSNQLSGFEELEEYNQNVMDIHSLYKNEFQSIRKAVVYLINERVVNRVEQFLKDGTWNIDSLYKQRKNILLDYDSHVRKATVYSAKKETVQSKRFQMKADHDKAMLDDFSTYLQNRLSEFITLGTKLLMTETATLVTCELYLIKQQYDALCEVGTNMGEELLFPILNDLDLVYREIVDKPESPICYTPPPIGLSVYPESDYPVFVSFNDFIKQSQVVPVGDSLEKSTVVLGDSFKQSPASDDSLEKSHVSDDSFNQSQLNDSSKLSKHDSFNQSQLNDSSKLSKHDSFKQTQLNGSSKQTQLNDSFNDPKQTQLTPSKENSPRSKLYINMKVKALYSCKSDEEGDLQFKKGDIITVLQFYAGGWWLGKCHGEVGIFPANYVQPL